MSPPFGLHGCDVQVSCFSNAPVVRATRIPGLQIRFGELEDAESTVLLLLAFHIELAASSSSSFLITRRTRSLVMSAIVLSSFSVLGMVPEVERKRTACCLYPVGSPPRPHAL